MKKAIVTGIRGQDGAYLSKFLLEKGYEVHGVDRRSGGSENWRLRELGIENEIKIHYMDLLELTNVLRVIKKIHPDEIYNLAAQSFVAASFEQPIVTTQVNSLGVLNILESIRSVDTGIKFYQASTSEMFGKSHENGLQNESTSFHPRSPYGVAKLYSHWITINYRESYGIHACSGILFNHESPLRGEEFVTRKITRGIAEIVAGKKDKIVLGNLEAKRDWGFAGDYVDGMWRMLNNDVPNDYVLATGETHSIKDFVSAAFESIGNLIRWEKSGIETKGYDSGGVLRIEVSPEFYRPCEVDSLCGDASLAKRDLGWSPTVKFEELVKMMVKHDVTLQK